MSMSLTLPDMLRPSGVPLSKRRGKRITHRIFYMIPKMMEGLLFFVFLNVISEYTQGGSGSSM